MRFVFTNLLLIAAAASAANAQCAPPSIVVRMSAAGIVPYSINGVTKPTLTLIEGQSYTFSFPTGTNAVPTFHPFMLSTDVDGGSGTATGQLTPAQLPGYTTGNHCASGCAGVSPFTITPSALTPSLFYYQCVSHTLLGNSITILRLPVITQQPAAVQTCRESGFSFTVAANIPGGGTPTYQWRRNGNDLGGLNNDTMWLPSATENELGSYDCVISNGCASIVSDAVPLTICPADVDDGFGLGDCDAAVDINDLLFFLTQFEAGSAFADIDDDAADPQMPDGSTDINDLLYFLDHFEIGC